MWHECSFGKLKHQVYVLLRDQYKYSEEWHTSCYLRDRNGIIVVVHYEHTVLANSLHYSHMNTNWLGLWILLNWFYLQESFILFDKGIYFFGFVRSAPKSVRKWIFFWVITPSSLFKIKRRFRGICRLHLQGRRISRARKQHEAGSKQSRAWYSVASACKLKRLRHWGMKMFLQKNSSVPYQVPSVRDLNYERLGFESR
jgi:hypothetical protein